jgi:hypothetical protein
MKLSDVKEQIDKYYDNLTEEEFLDNLKLSGYNFEEENVNELDSSTILNHLIGGNHEGEGYENSQKNSFSANEMNDAMLWVFDNLSSGLSRNEVESRIKIYILDLLKRKDN